MHTQGHCYGSTLPSTQLRFRNIFAAVFGSNFALKLERDYTLMQRFEASVGMHLCGGISEAICQAGDGQPDWRVEEFVPMIENFFSHPCFDSCTGASKNETMTLLVVLVGYEIARQRWGYLTEEDERFITESLSEFLSDLKLHARLHSVLDAEYERNFALNADLNVLQALSMLNSLLMQTFSRPHLELSKAEKPFSQGQEDFIYTQERLEFDRSLEGGLETPVSSPLASPSVASTLSPRSSSYYRDVRVQFFLKPSCSLDFGQITSFELPDDDMIFNTRAGVRMRVAEGVEVSEIYGTDNAVTIQSQSHTGEDFSAEVIVPPRELYCLRDVIAVEENTEIPDWTRVETLTAHIWIGNGPFRIMYDEIGGQIFVLNTYS